MVPKFNNNSQTQPGPNTLTSGPQQNKQNEAAPSVLQTLRNNQTDFNSRLTQLENQMHQFMGQMSTMMETMTSLQLMVTQTNLQTQVKLDQIASHLNIAPQESMFDDNDFTTDTGSRKRKSRRSSAADKTILSSPHSYASPQTSLVPPTIESYSNDNERRLANLESMLSSGMQQMATTTSSI